MHSVATEAKPTLAWCLVVALVVHALFIPTAHWLRSRTPVATHSPAAPEVEIAIDVITPSVTPVIPEQREYAPASVANDPRAATRVSRGTWQEPSSLSPASMLDPSAALTSTNTEPLHTNGDSTWSMPITNAPVNIGVNRSAFQNGLVRATPEALGAPESSAKVTSSLRGALAAHDVAIGMARGGVAVGAARSAVSRSLVPDESFAMIEVRFDNAGHAVSARVVDSKDDASSWDEAARDLVRELEGHTVRLPENAAGLSVFVRVDVSLRLPSGAKGSVTQSGLGGAFDMSDLGQSKARTVVARIVSETVL